MSNTQNVQRRTLALIDFSGFYESIHNVTIEDEAVSPFQDDSGEDCAPEEFHNAFHFNNEMLQGYCEKYIEVLKQYLSDENDLNVDAMTFGALISPRFYNFSTDQLLVSLTTDEIQALYQKMMTNQGPMKEVLKEHLTPCSGFIPNYSNDLSDWLVKDVLDWDTMELGLLLTACAGGGWNDTDVLASFDTFHEQVSEVLSKHMPKDADAIISRWHEQSQPAA
jgi:hypothetical protein